MGHGIKKEQKFIAAATQKNIRNAWEEKKSGENKRGIERMECEGASKADVYKPDFLWYW